MTTDFSDHYFSFSFIIITVFPPPPPLPSGLWKNNFENSFVGILILI